MKPDEIEALIAGAQKLTTAFLPEIIALLLYTGVRRSNVIYARWADFDLHNKVWHIPMAKSGKSQNIWLSPAAMQMIELLSTRGQSEWLFPNPQTHKPYTFITNAWVKLRQSVGMPHLRIHDLRHTFASVMMQQGYSLYVVQHALGHYSPTMTMRYAHLADNTLRDAMNSDSHALPVINQRLTTA